MSEGLKPGPGFEYACDASALADGGREVCEIGTELVLIVRIADQFFCISDVCTHDGGPLSDGELCDHQIECPRHGARFDLRTGAALCMPATQPTRVHECVVVEGQVFVRLSEV
jgi:3-phenylpropionate/trans-cinnamate dioxygenase ferredoxin subunit